MVYYNPHVRGRGFYSWPAPPILTRRISRRPVSRLVPRPRVIDYDDDLMTQSRTVLTHPRRQPRSNAEIRFSANSSSLANKQSFELSRPRSDVTSSSGPRRANMSAASGPLAPLANSASTSCPPPRTDRTSTSVSRPSHVRPVSARSAPLLTTRSTVSPNARARVAHTGIPRPTAGFSRSGRRPKPSSGVHNPPNTSNSRADMQTSGEQASALTNAVVPRDHLRQVAASIPRPMGDGAFAIQNVIVSPEGLRIIGTDVPNDAAAKRPDTVRKPHKKNGSVVYQHIPHDHPRHLLWRAALGEALAQRLGIPVENPMLLELPARYEMYVKMQFVNEDEAPDRLDVYVFGKHRFSSPNEFGPHLIWLGMHRGSRALPRGCRCGICYPTGKTPPGIVQRLPPTPRPRRRSSAAQGRPAR